MAEQMSGLFVTWREIWMVEWMYIYNTVEGDQNSINEFLHSDA